LKQDQRNNQRGKNHLSKIADAVTTQQEVQQNEQTKAQQNLTNNDHRKERDGDEDEDPDREDVTPLGVKDKEAWNSLGVDEDRFDFKWEVDPDFGSKFTVDLAYGTKDVYGGEFKFSDEIDPDYEFVGFRTKMTFTPVNRGTYTGGHREIKRNLEIISGLDLKEGVYKDGPESDESTNARSSSIGFDLTGIPGVEVSGGWNWTEQRDSVDHSSRRLPRREGINHQWNIGNGSKTDTIKPNPGLMIRVDNSKSNLTYDVGHEWQFRTYKNGYPQAGDSYFQHDGYGFWEW
jgi:hypothetical protein